MAQRTTIQTRDANLNSKISNPLVRLRGYIRVFVALDVALFAGLFLVIWFLGWIAFDYGVFKATGADYALHSHWGLRLAFIGVMLAILAAYIALRLTRLIRKDLSYTSLALVLEKRHPELLRDRLITAIELSDLDKAEAQGYSRAMVQQTIDEAHERVGQVNILGVFRWKRLWMKLVLASLFLVLFAGSALGIHALGTKAFSPVRGGHKLADVCSIWAERNLLMKNTPWPRRSHIELVGYLDQKGDLHKFPDTVDPETGKVTPGELRQGKDAGAPRIVARAYQWVVADPSRVEGWRPLAVADLGRAEFGIAPVDLSDLALTDAFGKSTRIDLSGVSVDDVEGTLTTEHESVRATFEKLNELAEDPWMSRTLRKLVLPNEMILTFTGSRSAGSSNALPVKGEYVFDVNGIKENRVSFVVRGEDYRTPPRFIELIPPPMLIDLRRDEYQPAYLYYPAPQGLDQASLRGRKQLFANQKISLTGEKSVFPVPTGTDVEITATADKPIRKVLLTPKGDNKKLWAKTTPGDGFGKVLAPPGQDGVRDLLGWEKSSDAGFEAFTVRFRGDDAVREQVEFEYTLTDLDNVAAKRSILIQVNEDQPPLVEVAVDVLRKVGNAYMCTPIAMIPFITESRVSDDTGLSKVEYEFSYTKVESSIVSTVQAQLAGGLAGSFGGPVRNFGLIGVLAGGRVIFEQIGTKTEQRQYGSAKVGRFLTEYDRLQRDTAVRLDQTLAATRDRGAQPGVVKLIKFLDPTSSQDHFDLRESLKMLLAPIEDIQPRYKVDLNITATDVNTELTGKDGQPIIGKKSSNVEPIRLLVVSEQDLLTEISKDEENQTLKLDEILKRVVECESKLSQELGLLSAPSLNQISSSAVRALDILQDVNKSKEQLSSVLIDFERLFREIQTNRCNPKLLEKYINPEGKGIIQETRRILDGTNPDGSFPQAEAALGAFQNTLNNKQPPQPPEVEQARTQLANLRLVLARLRAQSGVIQDVSEIRKRLQDLIDLEKLQARSVKLLTEAELDRLKSPLITSNKPIEVKVGQTVTVKHAIDWKLYAQGQLVIAIDTPKDSDLKVPLDITLKDDKNDFSYEVTAGAKVGSYTLKLKPFVGNTVEQQINVTK